MFCVAAEWWHIHFNYKVNCKIYVYIHTKIWIISQPFQELMLTWVLSIVSVYNQVASRIVICREFLSHNAVALLPNSMKCLSLAHFARNTYLPLEKLQSVVCLLWRSSLQRPQILLKQCLSSSTVVGGQVSPTNQYVYNMAYKMGVLLPPCIMRQLLYVNWILPSSHRMLGYYKKGEYIIIFTRWKCVHLIKVKLMISTS